MLFRGLNAAKYRFMRLSDILKKIKQIPDLPADLFVACVIILLGFGVYFVDDFTRRDDKRAGEVRVTIPTRSEDAGGGANLSDRLGPPSLSANISSAEQSTSSMSKGMYVGARGGKIYHLPWCSGAKRIKEQNQVWFASKADAESHGYKPASNCKGL